MQDIKLWQSIIQKLDQGRVSQSEVANELNLSRGQFRYRLQKAKQILTQEELAITITETDETPKQKVFSPSCFDDSWNRKQQWNHIQLMIKDDSALFVYWEYTPIRKQMVCDHLGKAWGEIHFSLRLHDVTDVHDIESFSNYTHTFSVHPDAEEWYFHSLPSGRNYFVEWGYFNQHSFFSLLRSGRMTLPATHVDSLISQPRTSFQVVSSFSQNPWNHQFTGYSLIE